MNKELEKKFDEEFGYEARVHYNEDVILHRIKQTGSYPEEISFEEFVAKLKAFIDKHFIAREDTNLVVLPANVYTTQDIEKMIGEDNPLPNKVGMHECNDQCHEHGYNKAKKEMRDKLTSRGV